jgi:hypothetical protein
MEAIHFSETLVLTTVTGHNIPEDGILYVALPTSTPVASVQLQSWAMSLVYRWDDLMLRDINSDNGDRNGL